VALTHLVNYLIASVTGQRCHWIAPAGSAD
jgi:hypothetical protein